MVFKIVVQKKIVYIIVFLTQQKYIQKMDQLRFLQKFKILHLIKLQKSLIIYIFLLIITLRLFGNIEAEIKRLEKSFSRQDLKGFEEKFEKDLAQKQYELESAKVFESASSQIDSKRQKFNSVSQKLINDYGKKYDEIYSKNISDDEKKNLANRLFDETKCYDEKNHQAVLKLRTENDKLKENFQGKVENVSTIQKQMQNLHLFDKGRYFEDMKASIIPELRDLYKKRYLLNSYRKEHNEPIYNGKQNGIFNIFQNVTSLIKRNKMPLMIGPHFERDYDLGAQANYYDVDKNMTKALAGYYGNVVTTFEKTDFEEYLSDYFKVHYQDLTHNNCHEFLTNFSKTTTDANSTVEQGDLFKIANYFGIDGAVFGNNFGTNLVIKDGLIYEESTAGINVIYTTDKAIASAISDLYGASLYYKHLSEENLLTCNNTLKLKDNFVKYAEQNGIELPMFGHNVTLKKRFIKKKKSNVVDFKQLG